MASIDPVVTAQTLVSNVGGQVLHAAVGIAPLAVPAVLSLTALAWVIKKFGVGGTWSMGQGMGHSPDDSWDNDDGGDDYRYVTPDMVTDDYKGNYGHTKVPKMDPRYDAAYMRGKAL